MYALAVLLLLAGPVEMPSDEVIAERMATHQDKYIAKFDHEKQTAIANLEFKIGSLKRNIKNNPRNKNYIAECEKNIKLTEAELDATKRLSPKKNPPVQVGDLSTVRIGDVLDLYQMAPFRVVGVVDSETLILASMRTDASFAIRGVATGEIADNDVLKSIPIVVAGGTDRTDGSTTRWVMFVFKGLKKP